ncbi:MAG: SRPBCC family protein [Gemmatimonadaceae bacterium]|nr:SRPBCC family protein [Chitinophagaceae bacterium]
MPVIHLTTFIAAPAERVFDLSRSIELHKKSMEKTMETAVAGTVTGLIQHNETVTWKGKHLGKTRLMKVRITDMKKPVSFTDEMVDGDFKMIKHEHHFKPVENGVLMIDIFSYETPYGNFGKIANKIFLNSYLTRLLEKRNGMIKEYAEGDKWKFLLNR